MSRKNLSLIVGAASLAMAAALWSSAAIAQSALSTGAWAGGARPAWSNAGRASLANPKPVRDDDDECPRRPIVRRPPARGNDERATGRAETHSVADHVLEGAAQELRIARHGELAVRRQLNLTAARSRLDRDVGGNRLQQLADIDARLLERVPGTLEARELQRARNELLEPLGLAGDAREVALHSAWLAARERERELQPSERRAKLVGPIPQPLPLRLEE